MLNNLSFQHREWSGGGPVGHVLQSGDENIMIWGFPWGGFSIERNYEVPWEETIEALMGQ